MLMCAYLMVLYTVLECMIEFCVIGVDWGQNQSFDRALMVEITLLTLLFRDIALSAVGGSLKRNFTQRGRTHPTRYLVLVFYFFCESCLTSRSSAQEFVFRSAKLGEYN